jgi:DNA-binding transcriptional LysR family regulator
MTFQQLKHFREVAMTKHFTMAAQNLFISQSSLSHSIQELEREIGVPLFIRARNKKIALTRYGDAFLPFVEMIFQNLQDGLKTIEDMRNPLAGVVKIVFSYINGFQFVPKIFKTIFSESDNSEISVQFEINHTDTEFEEEVALGVYDLAICATPTYKDLKCIPIFKQELVIILPQNHRLANEKRLSLKDIKDEEMISYYQGGNLDTWVKKMFAASELKPNISTYTPGWSTQYTYVALGLGIAISPRLPAHSSELSIVEIDHPLNCRDIFLLSPLNRKLSPAVNYVKKSIINICSRLQNEEAGIKI